MAGASISSQLQAIKTILNASADPEPGRRRPLTRASILFDAKAAADIDIDAIFDIALSGLEVLISMEERFKNYRSDLFSNQSKELDRELVGVEENKRINASISSYLRLLSGFLESHSALKTLEYLIRRYKIHVFNAEELILCALPYHDTHVFVQIVQLINTGNSRWKFLDGVKESGARLPREVIVQQCVRDMGVLEAICNYATTIKKTQPSKQMIVFCTAVVFEVLGFATVDSDVVKRILPFISSGLQPGARGPDQKAGALMIVTLLAQKAALAPNVVKSLMRAIADVARVDAKETGGFKWLRMSIMALINIVQLQNLELIPKKTVDVLNEIRDIPGILPGLNKEFDIEKFLNVFVESLLEYCSSDDLCHSTLISMIETVPMEVYINRIVSKLLTLHMNKSRGNSGLVSSKSGLQSKRVLTSLYEKYPNESREAFHTFLKSRKVASDRGILCQILDENLESSAEMPDPKILFALEHVEAEIRRSTILSLDVASFLQDKAAGSKKFDAFQDAIMRRLYDDDMNVVIAALNLKHLATILSPLLLEALESVLRRCIDSLLSRSSTNSSLYEDAAILCLQQVFTSFKDDEKHTMMLATIIFPFILIRPKVQRLNLKALELVKELKWPFYENLISPCGLEKKLEHGRISTINVENISRLAETFSLNPDEYMPWLVKCCNYQELSSTLFFLVLLQTLKLLKMGPGQFSNFFDLCFPILKKEWEKLECRGISLEQSKKRILNSVRKGNLEDLVDTNIKDLNSEILLQVFLRLSQAFTMATPENAPLDMKGKFVGILADLFLFFSSHSKGVFKNHLDDLVKNCKMSFEIILKFLSEEDVPYSVQVESLYGLSYLCSELDKGSDLQILVEFPCILVPLASDNKDVRAATMSCVEQLEKAWPHLSEKAGELGLHFLGELLPLITQQKEFILSDKNFLTSFFTSVLGSSSDSLLLQPAIGKSLSVSAKKEILDFILGHALKVPAHAKLNILRLLKGLGSKLMYVDGVKSLLNDLLEKHHHYNFRDSLYHKLSKKEVDILCILLESCARHASSDESHDFGDSLSRALQFNGAENSLVLEPCLTVLRNLSSLHYEKMKTETQELIFRNLLVLLRNTNGDIQNATRETLLRINVSCSVVGRVLDSILDQKGCSVGSAQEKSRKKSVKRQKRLYNDAAQNGENALPFLSSFLDVLLMKKNIENRTSLVGHLFKLLRLIFVSDDGMFKAADQDKASAFLPGAHQTACDAIVYIQQTLLITLEDICASQINDIRQKEFDSHFDLQLLVNCARFSSDAVTRNHVFLLITTLANFIPDQVLNQFLDILTAVGESAVTQWDSYSQSVFERLISAVVPCWLSRNENADDLLEIFVNILPQVAESRRLSIILHILRTLGEVNSLGSLLFLLFRSIISRKSLYSLDSNEISLHSLTSLIIKQWEYGFALQLCEQYACTIWLPSVILTLQKIRSCNLNEEAFMETVVAMQLVAEKLREPEMSYRLDSPEDVNNIQTTLGQLMEQVVFHLQLVDFNKKHVDIPAVIKKELKEYTRTILKTVAKGLLPSTYFFAIIQLIDHADENVKKKALGILCGTVKDLNSYANLEKKSSTSGVRNLWIHFNEISMKSFEKLCLKLLALLDASDEVSSTSLKLAVVSALEVLASRLPSHDSVFTMCLGSVCKRICSDNSALSSHCLRAAAAFIGALGPKALPELPNIMDSMLKKFHDFYLVTADTEAIINVANRSSNLGDMLMSILLILEAVINNLGGFLNPYLGDILKLVMLHLFSFPISELQLKVKADVVRKIITDKIPVRLLLPPLLDMYHDAVKYGGSSLSIYFEMLGNLVSSMDRSSVGAYHTKIYDLCLLALDLRRHGASIINIDDVERNVINNVVILTMKLTETMFRPVFIKTVEWSGCNVEDNGNTHERTISRAISFYGLVNKLAESHRSLFVPYFKYLLDGCIRHLLDSECENTGPTRKKKAKHSHDKKDVDGTLYLQLWHLRALILSSLHKCFLYDTGSTKFLDSSNFQVLLKPIVMQLVMDPPVENHPNTPSVKEVDDLLVACVGQMAVTAGSDLLWKPLNHEVLMQTRSEKVRARILGLRIVKHLVEKLKEEYLVFLPETIPFLGELLEDVELPVKSLAQEIIKEMEAISGESLREYL